MAGVGAEVCREATSYDLFFQENYEALQRWAMQITGYDRELSEDLVHDVYLRFSNRFNTYENIDSVHGYLYTALRNAHLTHLRRKTRSNQIPLTDFEQLGELLPAIDPRDTFKVHDQLRAICHYVRRRKSNSISASILILRFVHGYFSAEVARIVNRSRNAVEARLHKARREVSVYLSEDSSGIPNDKTVQQEVFLNSDFNEDGDLLRELRAIIFSSSTGRCVQTEWLRTFYRKNSGGLAREELSHIVSCAECLDNVNKLLQMPTLKNRHPLDTLGPQTTAETLERNQSIALFSACLWLLGVCIQFQP